MMTSFYVFGSIVTLFYLGLLAKKHLSWRFCTICAAVSITWILLAVARYRGWLTDDVLLALLVGESIVGSYYLLERRANESLLVFRLPVLLLLTFLGYALVSWQVPLATLGLVSAVWLLHFVLFAYRNNPRFKNKVEEVIACCSRW